MGLVTKFDGVSTNYNFPKTSSDFVSNINVTAPTTNINVPNYTSSKTEKIDLVPVVNEEEEIEEFGGIGDFLGCVGDTVSGYWDGFKSLFTEKEDGKTKILNILEDCGATVSNVCTSAVEGVAKFGEAVVDTAALAGTGILSLGTVLVEGVMSIPDVIENGVSGFDFSFTEYMYDQTRNFISKDHAGGFFDFYYNETDLGKWIKDNSYASETIRSVASGIGYTVGVIVLAMGTGGTSLAAESVTLAAPTAATMGMSAIAGGIGKGAETAYQSGADVQEGAEAALATGLWEGTQFYLGGKINGLSPFTSTAGNIGLRVGLDTIDGGAEGFVQPFISSIYEKGYYDENGNYIEFTDDYTFFDRYGEMWDDQGGWKQVGTHAAIGGIVSAGSEMAGYYVNKKSLKNIDTSNMEFSSIKDIKDYAADELNATELSKLTLDEQEQQSKKFINKVIDFLNEKALKKDTKGIYSDLVELSEMDISADIKSEIMSSEIAKNIELRKAIKESALEEVTNNLKNTFGIEDEQLSAKLVDKLLGPSFIEDGVGKSYDWDGFCEILKPYLTDKVKQQMKLGAPILWSKVDETLLNKTFVNTIENSSGGEFPFMNVVYNNWNSTTSTTPMLEEYWKKLSKIYVQACGEALGDNSTIKYIYNGYDPITGGVNKGFGNIFKNTELVEILSEEKIDFIELNKVNPNTLTTESVQLIDLTELRKYAKKEYFDKGVEIDEYAIEDIFKRFIGKVGA